MALIYRIAGDKAMMVLQICLVQMVFRAVLLLKALKATYVHCNCHVLNLCIVETCSLPPIRNMNSTITETAYFFQNSSKRQLFLEKIVDCRARTVKVKDLCRTRWVYRHEAYEHFSLLYTFLVNVMKA